MTLHEVSIRIGGAAGDGVASTGENFAKTASRSGLSVYAYNSYQSVIRGGHVWFQIRASPDKITSVGQHVDVLVALNQQTADVHLPHLRAGGGLIFDPKKVKLDESKLGAGVRAFPIPMAEIAKQFSTNPILQNTVAIGAAMQFIRAPIEKFVDVVKDTFGHKASAVVEANEKAARAGWDYAAQQWGPLDIDLRWGEPRSTQLIMTGNQAAALGALAGGCRFYSFYPMTPASSIGHYLADHGPEVGCVVKQAEDEIAVINMAIGAGHAGARSMCGTSGGGFALMVEALGLAGITETPVVVALSQRGGPSTGLPTKTEQGDLNLALGAGQGDYPRIILAPRNVTEAYHTAARAHNLAEKWQMPVILMLDLLLSEHMETVNEADLKGLEFAIDRGAIWSGPDGDKPFLRYEVTPSGVSARAFPGTDHAAYTAGSDEHDEDGTLVSDVRAGLPDAIDVRLAQMEKRMRKLTGAVRELEGPELVGPRDAPVTLAYWGSTQGAAREAMAMLEKEGVRVNALEFRDIFPLPADAALAALKAAKHVVFVEGNYTGQFARLVRAETGFWAPSHLRKFDGEPFWPEDIAQKVRHVLKGEHGITAPPPSLVPAGSPAAQPLPIGAVPKGGR